VNNHALMDGLGDEARVLVKGLLARAYEAGFREGLSAAGTLVPAVPPPPFGPAPVASQPEPAATGADPAASDGLTTPPASVAALAAPSPSPDLGPVAPPSKDPVAWDSDNDDDPGDDETEDSDAVTDTVTVGPVRSSLRIGSLLKRIEQTFDLSRFDIEVIICRRGDRDRRQLKSNVRLSKYVLDK
jgi:hypothetical protein